MKSTKLYAVVVTALVLGTVTACSSGANSANGGLTITKDVVTAASSMADPPMSMVKDGKPAGFDIDITEAMAKKLGYKSVKWVTIDFQSTIPGVAAKKFDIGASGITGWAPDGGAALSVVHERTKQVSFSRPYMLYFIDMISNGSRTPGLVKIDQIKPGMKAGVAEGTHMFLWAQKVLQPLGVNVIAMKARQVWTQLEAGTVDVGFDTQASLAEVKKQHPEFVEGERVSALTGGLAMAFAPENVKLREDFDQALGELIADGTYDKLYAKYFPGEKAPVLPINSYTHKS
jgi:ABC-type amino acid transport substrate-binding protein